MKYLRQTEVGMCGDIALRHLLMLVKKNHRYLLINEKLTPNASMLDIKNAAQTYGITLGGFRINDQAVLETAKLPLIVLLNKNKQQHYIVISKYKKSRYMVFDGVTAPGWVASNEFKEMDLEYALLIESNKTKRLLKKQLVHFKLRHKNLMNLSYLLTIVMLVLGMYFFDTSMRFVMPLLCFCLAAVFFILQQLTLIHSMRNFDHELLSKITTIQNNTDLISMYDYKRLIFTNPLQLINSGLLIIFIAVLLTLNDWASGIALLIVAMMTLLFAWLETKKLTLKISKLEQLETTLFDVGVNKSQQLHEINELSYHIGYQRLIYKTILLFILGSLALLLAALEGNVYLNFFLFQFGAYYLFSEQIRALWLQASQAPAYYQLVYRFLIM